MNAQVALLASSLLILAILLVDRGRKPQVSIALWIPVIWLVILASRPVASWFNPIQQVSDFLLNAEVESPLDRNILLVLMTLGAIVLLKRKLSWMQWLKANPWIAVFILYCGVSTLWSDFVGIAFKRWVRMLGALIMILIVLSETDPIAAIRVLFRRCAYVLVPMSVVLIKYYRSLGVTYNAWTGDEMLIGVTTNKNALGRLCLLSGLFLLWDLVEMRKHDRVRISTLHQLIGVGMFVMTLWLLPQSHSSTSLGSFVLGSSIFLVLGLSPIKKSTRFLGLIVVLTTLIVVGLDRVFNLTEMAVASLGRDMTFTDRTYIWEDLLALRINPVFGVGYDSFWLGPRLEMFVRKHLVAEAHNGYLEVYLELGLTGLFLLLGLVWSVFLKAKKSLMQATTYDYGRLQLVVLSIFLVYNVTEAAYKVTGLMAFTLLLIAVERPASQRSAAVATRGERALKPVQVGVARGQDRVRAQRLQR